LTASGHLGSIERAVPRADAWRQAPTGAASADGSYKEWMHFCVCLPGDPAGHLLVNLNVTESAGPGGITRRPRLIALGYLGEWTGVVESFENERVAGRAGALDLDLGRNRLAWRDGAFELTLDAGELEAQLRLRPEVLPTVASSVSFEGGHGIHWVAIPRLEASGSVRIARQRIELRRATAYHDHNWGRFRWGGDLSWEWGFVNPRDPACPFSAVFARVSDRGRHRTLSQSALLWRGDALVRTFQDREIRMTLEGAHEGPRPFTLPAIASLLVPGTSAGVPARVRMDAGGRGERLTVEFETRAKARVGIPSDVDPFGLLLLNETCGDARVTGSIDGEAFDFDGPAVMEFVRG
jgi:hypothetical protein